MKSTIKQSLLILSIVLIYFRVYSYGNGSKCRYGYLCPSASGDGDGSSGPMRRILILPGRPQRPEPKFSLSPVHITARLL